MDTRSFELHNHDTKELRELSDKSSEFEKRLVELTETQHSDLKPMQPTQRKGYMRNQPCVCGSGIKFKKCCWSYYAHHPLPVVETAGEG